MVTFQKLKMHFSKDIAVLYGKNSFNKQLIFEFLKIGKNGHQAKAIAFAWWPFAKKHAKNVLQDIAVVLCKKRLKKQLFE